MSATPCGCEDNNCPHRTSEVNLFDGMFTNITVPSGAGLNEVLTLLENYIITVGTCNDVNYTLDAFSACLNLPAGTYSFTQIIDAIVTRICTNASNIEELTTQVSNLLALNTTNVILSDIVFPPCFSSFTGTTSTDLFNTILSQLCSVLDVTAPTTGNGGVTVTPPDPGTTIDPNGTNVSAFLLNSRLDHISEVFKSFVDNNSFIYEHTSPVVSPTSFVVGLQPMRGVIENYLVIRDITENLTVNPSKDTYFYFSGDSSVLRREVANGAPAPAIPTGSQKLYTIVSDGSGVVSVTSTYTSNALNPVPLATGSVDTNEIANAAVTTAKIASINVGSTIGHPSLLEITNNNEGQVTGMTSNMLFAGLADGQVLVYNSGLNRFDNVPNTAIPAVGYIPKSNASGDNYTASSLLESASQVLIEKKVEINDTGLASEDDTDAIFNMVGGPMKMPRINSAAASLLPLNDAYFVYVTDTNVTFTSIGFWGVEAGVWVKL